MTYPMSSQEVKIIGEIPFHDVVVNVYYAYYTDKNTIQCCWQMRNPKTCYEGIMYMNYVTGKISYPEGTVLPEQTDEDREILPKFIVIGKPKLNKRLLTNLKSYLESDYVRRNKNYVMSKLSQYNINATTKCKCEPVKITDENGQGIFPWCWKCNDWRNITKL